MVQSSHSADFVSLKTLTFSKTTGFRPLQSAVVVDKLWMSAVSVRPLSDAGTRCDGSKVIMWSFTHSEDKHSTYCYFCHVAY